MTLVTPTTARRERWLTLLVILLGASLRLSYQHGRPFVGDEVGTLINIENSASYIMTHYERWLSMNFFILLTKWIARSFGHDAWVLTALPLAAGIASIPLTAALARRLGAPRWALPSALLVAVNPYLVVYSAILRSYSILIALVLLCLITFLRWRDARTWRRGWCCALCVFLCCLFHPVGVYTALFIGAWLVLEAAIAWRQRRFDGKAAATLWVPMVCSGIALVAVYAPLYHDMKVMNEGWTEAGPTGIAYLGRVFTTYFAGGYAALLPLALLVAGLWAAAARHRRLLILPAFCALPVLVMSLQGVSHFDSAYARFLVCCLPCLLILVVAGADWLASWLPRSRGWLTHALVIALGLDLAPRMATHFEQKERYPWPEVARHLAERRAPGHVVVCARNDELELWPYSRAAPDYFVPLSFFLDDPRFEGAALTTMYFVSSNGRLETSRPCVRYGVIQIVTYSGATRREMAGQLYEDLTRTVEDRVHVGFAAYYQALCQFDRYLELPDDLEKHRRLYSASVRQRSGQREYAPDFHPEPDPAR